MSQVINNNHGLVFARAWLLLTLLLGNQLAVAMHGHTLDDVKRPHQCQTCLQLHSGQHAAVDHAAVPASRACPPRLQDQYPDGRPLSPFQPAYHSRAPPA